MPGVVELNLPSIRPSITNRHQLSKLLNAALSLDCATESIPLLKTPSADAVVPASGRVVEPPCMYVFRSTSAMAASLKASVISAEIKLMVFFFIAKPLLLVFTSSIANIHASKPRLSAHKMLRFAKAKD